MKINYLCVYVAIFLLLAFINSGVVFANDIRVNPDTYHTHLQKLQPGDSLILSPGVYLNGLPLDGVNGSAENPIRIRTENENSKVKFLARDFHNTISIVNSSYLVISGLELDGNGKEVDAIKAEGHSDWAHHITLENLFIHSHNAEQNSVGISTKCPAWGWIIRNSKIINTGTGIYFGDSDGTAAFVQGVIENNIILNTQGYNLQIKHQSIYPEDINFPEQGSTIIRGNIFSKESGGSTGNNVRPNVLVGHWPLSGKGSKNIYYIYGNYFYQNDYEALFQGEGNIALYNNLLVNNSENGDGILIRPHNGEVRDIHIFYNTILTQQVGIEIEIDDKRYIPSISSNVIFADKPITGGREFSNIKYEFGAASSYLKFYNSPHEECFLYPQNLENFSGRRLDPIFYKKFPNSKYDFNGHLREGKVRGAFLTTCTSNDWHIGLNSSPNVSYSHLDK